MLLSYLEGHNDLGQLIAWILGATVAITVHEYAHARRALAAGDPTARDLGRVTLNPLAHYDPIGSTLFLFAGIGWAKPVPVDPRNFRNLRRDELWVSAWGPLSNLCTAVVFAIMLRAIAYAGAMNLPVYAYTAPYTEAIAIMTLANCVLAIFNLIPIAPLDGSHILAALLPPKQALQLEDFYRRNGRYIMIGAIVMLFVPPFSTITQMVLMTPIFGLFTLLTGSGGF